MLTPDARLPVQSSLDAYGRIPGQDEANGATTLPSVLTSTSGKKCRYATFMVPNTGYFSAFPLPGDNMSTSLTLMYKRDTVSIIQPHTHTR
jgi:hypothetical protein